MGFVPNVPREEPSLIQLDGIGGESPDKPPENLVKDDFLYDGDAFRSLYLSTFTIHNSVLWAPLVLRSNYINLCRKRYLTKNIITQSGPSSYISSPPRDKGQGIRDRCNHVVKSAVFHSPLSIGELSTDLVIKYLPGITGRYIVLTTHSLSTTDTRSTVFLLQSLVLHSIRYLSFLLDNRHSDFKVSSGFF